MVADINAADINIFSICILAVISFHIRRRAEHAFIQHRLYRLMVAVIMLALVMETTAQLCDGRQGAFFSAANRLSVMSLYLLTPLIPSLWALYADSQIFRSKSRLSRYSVPIVAYVALDWAFIIASIRTGWMFRFDEAGAYIRGPLLAVHVLACYAWFAYVMLIVLLNRKRISRSYFVTLLLIAVPPVIGGLAQYFFYGTSLLWSGLSLSVLLLYFNIQDSRLDTDYLTGVYNRRLMDRYVREKVRLSAGRKTFSAILLDVDNFKHINDTYGHAAGDEVLTEAVKLLRRCLRSGDFIARYGGDEFLVVLDIGSQRILEETVERIRKQCAAYSARAGVPLSFSMGYAVYDGTGGMDAGSFLESIDRRMYEDKKNGAGARGNKP